MSGEEDKSALNDVDDANASRPIDGDDGGGGGGAGGAGAANGPPDTLTIDCNASSPPCQLDIGLGTHTDSRRLDNSSNGNGKTHVSRTTFYPTALTAADVEPANPMLFESGNVTRRLRYSRERWKHLGRPRSNRFSHFKTYTVRFKDYPHVYCSLYR